MPIKMTVTPENLLSIENMTEDFQDSAAKLIFEIGLLIRSIAVRNIQKGDPRTGIERRAKKSRRLRTSSAKGEYPKSDTGRLAQSLIVAIHSRNRVETGALVKYGKWLEFGTPFMDARPFIQPSIKKAEKKAFKLGKIRLGDAFDGFD